MTGNAIDNLFRRLINARGSDLHLAAGKSPRIRTDGELEPIEGWPEPQTDDDLKALLEPLAEPRLWKAFLESGDLDFAYTLPGEARFRANYLRQLGGIAAVFRLIPEKILTAEELGLVKAVAELAYLPRGLVLITGPTGSGKSTTLAAIIDLINRNYEKHVMTIEDPVEFVHENRKSVISQRQVGVDSPSFAAALRAAVRQDADVILVGEMRDLETIALAITAAEMGSLVFGTLHTNSAAKTIDRLIDVFPAEEQSQVRTTLADSLAAVVAQQLLPAKTGRGRHAAFEILLRSSGLPNVIREGNTPMLRSIIQGGKSMGMCSMDESLKTLVDAGKVDPEDALRRATDRRRFAAQLKNSSRPADRPAYD